MGLTEVGNLGYGIHYPIRHGQVDNWVRRASWSSYLKEAIEYVSDRLLDRTTWNVSGKTPFLSTSESSRKITTSSLLSQ